VHFSAAHRLHNPDLSDDENRRIYGLCNSPNWHGHNYELDVTVEGEIDPETGFVLRPEGAARGGGAARDRRRGPPQPEPGRAWLEGVNPTTENLVVAIWRRLRAELPAGAAGAAGAVGDAAQLRGVHGG
jgi:6-pyruvoyltetrahydropterin/6-carboxytetrahydropterin synthase